MVLCHSTDEIMLTSGVCSVHSVITFTMIAVKIMLLLLLLLAIHPYHGHPAPAVHCSRTVLQWHLSMLDGSVSCACTPCVMLPTITGMLAVEHVPVTDGLAWNEAWLRGSGRRSGRFLHGGQVGVQSESACSVLLGWKCHICRCHAARWCVEDVFWKVGVCPQRSSVSLPFYVFSSIMATRFVLALARAASIWPSQYLPQRDDVLRWEFSNLVLFVTKSFMRGMILTSDDLTWLMDKGKYIIRHCGNMTTLCWSYELLVLEILWHIPLVNWLGDKILSFKLIVC